MSVRRFVGITAGLLPLLTSGTAQALEPFPENNPYVSVQGGPMVVVRDWDLVGANRDLDVRPNRGLTADYGAQLGWQLDPQFAIEAGVTALMVSSNFGSRNTVVGYELDALYHINASEISPYVLGGAGGYHAVSGDMYGDIDPAVHVGFGVRMMLNRALAFRSELRYTASDGKDLGGSSNIGLRVGFDTFVPDRIPPDTDMDGIIDEEDMCPTLAGDETAKGCPDRDGDTITDSGDRCPADEGPLETGGCPDTDADGIIDLEDRCPELAGDAAFGGCPDTDGDSLADPDDECPTDAGPAVTAGCPDRDDDGVADKDDLCPDTRGLPSQKGCIPEEVLAFTGTIEGIYFQSGSATIQRRSFSTLDSAIAVLSQFEDLRLRIEGHTDNRGSEDTNMTLSQARADSVRTYMMEKGIDGGRLIAEGFGPSRPVADNGSSAGRAENRRIEFTILSQTDGVEPEAAPSEPEQPVEEAPAEDTPAEGTPAEDTPETPAE